MISVLPPTPTSLTETISAPESTTCPVLKILLVAAVTSQPLTKLYPNLYSSNYSMQQEGCLDKFSLHIIIWKHCFCQPVQDSLFYLLASISTLNIWQYVKHIYIYWMQKKYTTNIHKISKIYFYNILNINNI